MLQVNLDRLDCTCLVWSGCVCAPAESLPLAHTHACPDPPCPLPITADCSCLENLDEIKYYKNYKFVKGNICSSDLVNYVLEEEVRASVWGLRILL